MLTKEKILRAPKKNYMDKDQLSFFKTQLNELKKETLKHIKDAKDRLSNPPACSDEVDRAQHEIDSMLFLRIVERESKLLPKICLLYTYPSPRDVEESRMPSSA